MKIFNFGSLNIDKVYSLPRIAAPGETLQAAALTLNAGGKGLNQSLAAARAGAEVVHLGAVGPDGGFLEELLRTAGVDTSRLLRLDTDTGHAIIQVDAAGQNAILVYGGANRALPQEYLDEMLSLAEPGDLILLQNETNGVEHLLSAAHGRGLTVVFNPSPFPAEALPYEKVGIFLLNELEGAALAGLTPGSGPAAILDALSSAYPDSTIVLTLGSQGAMCRRGGETVSHPAYSVSAVDTTAAGDTFTGYFLAALCRGEDLSLCLKEASAASAIAVTRPGAAPSIPAREEVAAFLDKH